MDESRKKFIAREGSVIIIVYLISFVILFVRYHSLYAEPFSYFRESTGGNIETLIMDILPIIFQQLGTALLCFIPIYIVYLVARFFIWSIITVRKK